jgi:DNA-binding LacI/PurR family transcriptional regulator
MGSRIVVASANLGAGFCGAVLRHLKKLLRPGQTIVECAVPAFVRDNDRLVESDQAFLRSRVEKLIEEEPPPGAYIGICVRFGPAFNSLLTSRGVPIVLIDEEDEGVSTVSYDNDAAGHLVGTHLAERGRRTVTLVSGALKVAGSYNAVQRAKGFARALAARGIPFELERAIEVPTYSHQDGVDAMNRILAEGRVLDAIFCSAGDATATGILQVARQRAIQVPGQIALIGFDDSPMASISEPPLTSVRQSAQDMAAAAFRLITDEAEAILQRPKKVLLQPELVVRAST